MLLSIQNLSFGWREEVLLDRVNTQLDFGDMVILQGENGCGKTTLIKLITGMIPHFSRGKILEGDILIDGRSIIDNPPKSFFPDIAYVPSRNIDFFLLNSNLDEEMALIESVLEKDQGHVRQRKLDLFAFFPGLKDLWKRSFNTFSEHQKVLALTGIYYLQDARLYLLDEFMNVVVDNQINRWRTFFAHLLKQGKGIILTTHQSIPWTTSVWMIQDKMLSMG